MLSARATVYRLVLRELRRSIEPPRKVNRTITAHFRSMLEGPGKGDNNVNVQNGVDFLRFQREHKHLLARYNPLFDLTAQERIAATANRVGLNIPKTSHRNLHVQHSRFMAPPAEFSTQIVRCDPGGITFLPTSDAPHISSKETREALNLASHHLVDLKETVVFPTETVYGLGALALDATAASKIFSTKGRPPDNPLIVHVSSLGMLRSLLPPHFDIPKAYKVLMKHFWPGPLTLLFPRNSDVVPGIISANHHTVAIRMPSHPVARALIAVANAPLAAPSANTSGKPSPTRAEHVHRDLNGKLRLILDGGPCSVGLESTVVDGLHVDGNIRVLRPGGVTVEDIERVLRQDIHDIANRPRVLVHKRDYMDEEVEDAPTTPGMKYRHYSPSVPVILLLTRSATLSGAQLVVSFSQYINALKVEKVSQTGSKIGVMAVTESKLWESLDGIKAVTWIRYPLGPLTEPSVIAHRLFDGLLSLEQERVDCIFIEEVEEYREGLAIMNRIRKAASNTVRIID